MMGRTTVEGSDAAERPRVHLNCAVSLDGKVALPGGKPLVLSGPEDLARVHRLRAGVDGVLVGIGTVLKDDPSLLAKEALAGPVARQPARVVLDSRARTPATARVLDGRAPCFLLTTDARLDLKGARVLPVGGGLRVDLRAGLEALRKEGIERLLVEGGPTVLASFLTKGFADALTVYVAPVLVGPSAPGLGDAWPSARAGGPPGLALRSVERLGEGALYTFGRG